MKKGESLAARSSEVEVTTLRGDATGLPSLWSDRTILLVFLRHFG